MGSLRDITWLRCKYVVTSDADFGDMLLRHSGAWSGLQLYVCYTEVDPTLMMYFGTQDECCVYVMLAWHADMCTEVMPSILHCYWGIPGLGVTQSASTPACCHITHHAMFCPILMLYFGIQVYILDDAWFLNCISEKAIPSLVGHYWSSPGFGFAQNACAGYVLHSEFPNRVCNELNGILFISQLQIHVNLTLHSLSCSLHTSSISPSLHFCLSSPIHKLCLLTCSSLPSHPYLMSTCWLTHISIFGQVNVWSITAVITFEIHLICGA